MGMRQKKQTENSRTVHLLMTKQCMEGKHM